jgi:hypothetical protein
MLCFPTSGAARPKILDLYVQGRRETRKAIRGGVALWLEENMPIPRSQHLLHNLRNIKFLGDL